MEFEFKSDKEKQLLYGPFLIPNKLIYRKDAQNGEYYVRFSKDEVEKIANKFNQDLNNSKINLMHTNEMVDAYVTQNWVVEGDQDKSQNFGFDLPEGTWFGAVKVKDEDFWNKKVKNDEVRGFSVEILADLQLSLKNKEQQMNKNLKLGSTMLGDGTTPIYYDGEDIGVGTAIFTDEAMTMPAADDRWVLVDGRTITVIGGAVTLIDEASTEEATVIEKFEIDAPLMGDMKKCMEEQMALGKNEEDAKKMCGEEKMAEEPMMPEPAMPETKSEAITAEEVSMMIDARFGDLMEEISNLKKMLGDTEEEYNDFKKSVNDKFSIVPAVASITKTKVVNVDDKFSKLEQRIKEFAKNK